MDLLEARVELDWQGGDIVAFRGGGVEGSCSGRGPPCVLGDFSAYYISDAVGEIGEVV